MYIERILNIQKLLKRKSHFLLGPRQTGKSFLIQQQLSSKAIKIDLLSQDILFRLSSNPSNLSSLVKGKLQLQNSFKNKKQPSFISKDVFVSIDEIQKLPILLEEVHRLIEKYKWRFLLTGSSSRKLKKTNVNLLAGRAWNAEIFPLVWPEIPSFKLQKRLLYGGLPSVYLSKYPLEDLRAYTQNYLKEEILSEGLIKNLPQFSRFLEVATFYNGQLLNFSRISSDYGIHASTVREYYYLLEDTLMGFFLESWGKSKKRKAISRAKFYFFDTGTVNSIKNIKALHPQSNLFGNNFEHWIALELRAWNSYNRLNESICYWRSISGFEVDFIIGDHTAIEVKATKRISKSDLKGLLALKEEKKWKNLCLVSCDPNPLRTQGIECLHYTDFLNKLWKKK